jgi:hypothetical protein
MTKPPTTMSARPPSTQGLSPKRRRQVQPDQQAQIGQPDAEIGAHQRAKRADGLELESHRRSNGEQEYKYTPAQRHGEPSAKFVIPRHGAVRCKQVIGPNGRYPPFATIEATGGFRPIADIHLRRNHLRAGSVLAFPMLSSL